MVIGASIHPRLVVGASVHPWLIIGPTVAEVLSRGRNHIVVGSLPLFLGVIFKK
jgi:hypothetical protein